mgnify:CR=1 FL=1
MFKQAKKYIALLILTLMASIVVIFGANSFAKYTLKISEELVGYYVDYRLSHTGDGKSALVESISPIEDKDSNNVTYKYDYVGFVTFSVSNVLDGKISQRDVDISLRTPTLDETNNGAHDAWGQEFDISSNSKYYEVELVSSSGDSIDSSSNEYKELTHFPEKVSKTSYITLKIKRRTTIKPTKNGNNWTPSNQDVPELNGVEEFSVIIESFAPYKDLHVFNIKVASTLIMISSIETTYFGFNVVEVEIKTSRVYTFGKGGTFTNSYLPVKVDLYYENLVFDEQRFIINTQNNYIKQNTDDSFETGYYLSDNKITLYVPASSSLTVYFIKPTNSGNITSKVLFKDYKDDIIYYTQNVTGAISITGTGDSAIAKIY